MSIQSSAINRLKQEWEHESQERIDTDTLSVETKERHKVLVKRAIVRQRDREKNT